MNLQAHVLGEFLHLLESTPNVESLSDEAVGRLLGKACARYRVIPSATVGLRIAKSGDRNFVGSCPGVHSILTIRG